ncbi:hypothetical protein QP185_04560 [Sphingomonas aerolata]|uniref:hypothetical protein n=1 Tax=Sphingomonas aerolata TaxID=185951 RepID=UPI002FE4020B
MRTVTTINGRTRIVDTAWRGGTATPGMAVITTTETIDEDDEGHMSSRTVVTCIEPQRTMVAAVSYAPPPAPASRSTPPTSTSRSPSGSRMSCGSIAIPGAGISSRR